MGIALVIAVVKFIRTAIFCRPYSVFEESTIQTYLIIMFEPYTI